MAELGFTLDPTQHDTDTQDFELLPNMNARMEVIAGEVREEGNNKTAILDFGIIEPEQFARRRIRMWIDAQHDDAKKQEDGQRVISALCRSINLGETVTNTDQLLFQAFVAKVENVPAGVNKQGVSYKARNTIRFKYFPDKGNIPEIGILDAPATFRAPANDNRPASGDARTTGNGGAVATKARPWGAKKAA